MASFSDSYASLTAAQKSAKGVSYYSRLINRPVGRVLAALCHSRGLSPNAVTVISAGVTLLGLIAFILVPDSLAKGLLVAPILMLGFALDSADGQVARLAKLSSPAGEWADHVVDAGKMVAVHSAVVIYAYHNQDWNNAWIWIPLLFQLTATVQFAGMIIFELLRRIHVATHPVATERAEPVTDPLPSSTIKSLGLLPADYGVLCLSFLFIGVPVLFGTVYTVLFVLNFAICVLLLHKWFKALRAL